MTSDDELARDLAVAAGERLLAIRSEPVGDPACLRAAGDRQSHVFLAAELARQRPGDAVLSEEGQDDPARLSARRVWIVDPLDGTREFGEPGRTDWAVHVALWADGELTARAVALPAQGRVLSTAEPVKVPEPPAGPIRLLVSRSRPPQFVQDLAERLGAVLVPMGSAGAKAAAVIAGEAVLSTRPLAGRATAPAMGWPSAQGRRAPPSRSGRARRTPWCRRAGRRSRPGAPTAGPGRRDPPPTAPRHRAGTGPARGEEHVGLAVTRGPQSQAGSPTGSDRMASSRSPAATATSAGQLIVPGDQSGSR